MLRVLGLAAGLGLALSTGVAAQSGCPSGVARDGVWLSFSDRSVLTRVQSDGTIAEIEFAQDGSYVYVYRTLPVGLVTESWALVNGFASREERETVSYQGTPAAIPGPMPGARFDGIETARYPDGGETRSSVSLVVGSARPVSIGGCAYTGLPIDVTRVDLQGGPPQRDSMMHLLELGLTIYLGFSEGAEPPQNAMPLTISMTPPPVGGTGMSDGGPVIAPPPLPAPTK
ncbi:hypothetical protein [Roseicyclus marinus]|uniref:hypothetical protein n=1 Tax=Roseicyclus marinus TaxID=2161673 RepID=UPI002410B032|nr:hypothetical protein [Roseicyclus marinus]MDG3040388.1 hypothetical protein [Roseicyclus marinus]